MTGNDLLRPASRSLSPSFDKYLAPTWYIDSDHPSVAAHAQSLADPIAADDSIARAVALFNDVRDRIPYNPYGFSMEPESLKASSAHVSKGTFCIPKAILLAALARVVGIPSRLGFADVKNHLASDRLIQLMQTDVFAFHGYTELYLDGRWVKVTPAFDSGLCRRFNVPPLEFDGRHDAMLQPFNENGDQYMEYIRVHGSFDDMPLDAMLASFREHYPHWFASKGDC